MDNEERIAQAEQTVKDLNILLVRKEKIFLEIEVLTEGAADEIWQWMYSKTDSPMKATLIQVAWDKVLVPKDAADAAKIIQNSEPI